MCESGVEICIACLWKDNEDGETGRAFRLLIGGFLFLVIDEYFFQFSFRVHAIFVNCYVYSYEVTARCRS